MSRNDPRLILFKIQRPPLAGLLGRVGARQVNTFYTCADNHTKSHVLVKPL